MADGQRWVDRLDGRRWVRLGSMGEVRAGDVFRTGMPGKRAEGAYRAMSDAYLVPHDCALCSCGAETWAVDGDPLAVPRRRPR